MIVKDVNTVGAVQRHDGAGRCPGDKKPCHYCIELPRGRTGVFSGLETVRSRVEVDLPRIQGLSWSKTLDRRF